MNSSFKENVGREQLLEKTNPKTEKGLVSPAGSAGQGAVWVKKMHLVSIFGSHTSLFFADTVQMWQHDGIHFQKSSASNVIKAANPFLKNWNDAFFADTQINIKALLQVLFF